MPVFWKKVRGKAYFTPTVTVKVWVLPGGTKCRPILVSGELGGPIHGSTQ
jgi:hypothetical protein